MNPGKDFKDYWKAGHEVHVPCKHYPHHNKYDRDYKHEDKKEKKRCKF